MSVGEGMLPRCPEETIILHPVIFGTGRSMQKKVVTWRAGLPIKYTLHTRHTAMTEGSDVTYGTIDKATGGKSAVYAALGLNAPVAFLSMRPCHS
jgi:hypothetical protein